MAGNMWHLRNIKTERSVCGSRSKALTKEPRTVNCPVCKNSRYYGYYMTFKAEGKIALNNAEAKYDRLEKRLEASEVESGERGKEIIAIDGLMGKRLDDQPEVRKQKIKAVLRRFDLRCVKNPEIIKKLMEEPLTYKAI